MRSKLAAVTIAALALAIVVPVALRSARTPTPPTQAQPPLLTESLTVLTKQRAILFVAEIAKTERQKQIGLMFRTSLPPLRGMLFPFNPAQNVSFWMKDTRLPLDMLFIRADGTIARIFSAKAMDETANTANQPVAAVFEIAHGQAKELGIKEGDKVVWRRFDAHR